MQEARIKDVRVAAVGICSNSGELQQNLERHCAWVERAASAGAQLIVFPEASLTGYDLNQIKDAAIELKSDAAQTLAALAERRNVLISFALLERAPEGCYVTQAIVGPGLCLHHRKCHRTAWELQHCLAGSSLSVQDIGIAKLGTLICYDSAFPAAAETLVRAEAEILIQPSCHGQSSRDLPNSTRPAEIIKRRRHVAKYWGARAYDFTSYAVYVNHAGENKRGDWFPSYCGIFGPDGEVIAENVEEGEHMVIADLSGEFLTSCREQRVGHFQTLADARPELYR